MTKPDRSQGLSTWSWKFIFSWIAGFLAAAMVVLSPGTPCAGTPLAPVLPTACSAAAFSRRANCRRSLLAAGRPVTTDLKAAAVADVGMADTSLQAMLRSTGVAAMAPGGLATSISSGTRTVNTAACKHQKQRHTEYQHVLYLILAPLQLQWICNSTVISELSSSTTDAATCRSAAAVRQGQITARVHPQCYQLSLPPT